MDKHTPELEHLTPEAAAALAAFEDPTVGIPLYVNAGLPLTNDALERLFDQDGG